MSKQLAQHISEVTNIGALFFAAEICPSMVGYGIIRDKGKEREELP